MVFYLYADSSRMTKEVDPYARQMMISQGTFLEYVAVAGASEGWKADISLFPNGTYDESHLASSMDSEVLEELGVRNFDVCFVCISDNFQASMITTKPRKSKCIRLSIRLHPPWQYSRHPKLRSLRTPHIPHSPFRHSGSPCRS